MIASAHIAGGAVVGLAIARVRVPPFARATLAFAAGVLSHIAMDAIPHADYRPFDRPTTLAIAAVETLVACMVIAMLLRRRMSPGAFWTLLAGFAGATLPDAKFFALVVLPAHLAERAREYGGAFHEWFHAPPPPTPMIGWALEIGAAVILFLALARFPKTARRIHLTD